MQKKWPTAYATVLETIESIDPVAYARTRNYTDGAVTRLSPYVSRGVISTRLILKSLVRRGFRWSQVESLVRELAWRDYFQRVWQHADPDQDLRAPQQEVDHHELPTALLDARTGVDAIDAGIRALYATGYVHNHVRMYIASLACNVGRAHWRTPARWMYYHLVDGDWASNACSWQWVAGAFSNKKYLANQENIDRYTGTAQRGSFLDVSYDELPTLPVPEPLRKTTIPELSTRLPVSDMQGVDPSLPAFIYTYYHLDPLWRANEDGNRILLLEPSHFEQYPVGEHCLNFVLDLARNIPGIRIFTGSFEELIGAYPFPAVYFREHPLARHFRGIQDERDWMVPAVDGYFPSFFSYWKKIEHSLAALFRPDPS